MGIAHGGVWLVVLCALMAGCGPGSQDTPRATLAKAEAALRGGDRETFLMCFQANEDEVALLNLAFDCYRRGREFKRKLVKAHGEKGWDAFEERAGQGTLLPLTGPADADWMASVPIDVIGSKAEVATPDFTFGRRMVEEDGRWYILASGETWLNYSPQKLAAVLQVTEDGLKVVDKPGVSPADVAAFLRTRYDKAMMD